jgi:hypothetical protein
MAFGGSSLTFRRSVNVEERAKQGAEETQNSYWLLHTFKTEEVYSSVYTALHSKWEIDLPLYERLEMDVTFSQPEELLHSLNTFLWLEIKVLALEQHPRGCCDNRHVKVYSIQQAVCML